MSEPLPVFDKTVALERAGGSAELANELFGMLHAELPSYATALRADSAQADYAAVRETAHRIKGSATYCGVPALGHAAEQLEGRLKRGETSAAEGDLELLLTEIDRVLALPATPH